MSESFPIPTEDMDLAGRLRRGGGLAVSGPPDLAMLAEHAGLLDVAITGVDTPVGRLALAATEAGVVACSYDGEDAVAARVAAAISPRVLRAPARLDPVRRELEEYFAGRRARFSTTVDLRLATPFGQRVLRALGAVPYGMTTTYGALASRMGRPGAARAVGHALGANPICVIVPCHRVVGASGALTGYAGGLEIKRRLLDLERQSEPGSAGRPEA